MPAIYEKYGDPLKWNRIIDQEGHVHLRYIPVLLDQFWYNKVLNKDGWIKFLVTSTILISTFLFYKDLANPGSEKHLELFGIWAGGVAGAYKWLWPKKDHELINDVIIITKNHTCPRKVIKDLKRAIPVTKVRVESAYGSGVYNLRVWTYKIRENDSVFSLLRSNKDKLKNVRPNDGNSYKTIHYWE